jgi:GLPGLI family protein
MRKLIIIFISLSCSLQAFSQLFEISIKELEKAEFTITYSVKYKPDSLNPNSIGEEKMLLFIGKDISEFLSYYSYFNDIEMRKMETSSQLQEWLNTIPPMPNIPYYIYKNYPAGKITYIEHAAFTPFKYEENLELFTWQLSTDTATIRGYHAQKATTSFGGRDWVAWFAPELPYNDGPYKFNGLPGLIVKVYDTRNHYVFEMTSIEKAQEGTMITMREMQYIETTKFGFFKAKDAFRDDIINRVKEKGITDSNDLQLAARNMARQNNPIELIRK